ncbi:MAG TPA: hypothetical protein VGI80_03025, partial [Pyrinomonadaceae bacterium]
MADNNDNGGTAAATTDAIGGSNGAKEGMGGGGGMGGTQTPNSGVSADVDSPGSELRGGTSRTSGTLDDDDKKLGHGGSEIETST